MTEDNTRKSDFEKAKALIHDELFKEALELLLLSVEKEPSAEICNFIGELYHGLYTKGKLFVDYNMAHTWYEKALEYSDDDGEAANHLGRLYCNGEGVERDLEKAKYWYHESMLKGNKYGALNYKAISE